MPYLFLNDFKQSIQADNLQQIVNKDSTIIDGAVLAAQEDVKEATRQKYLIDQELTDTNSYDPTISYTAGQRVYLDASSYDSTKTYAVGVLTLQMGSIYKCSTTISAPEAFNIAHWTLLGLQYDMFYISMQQPVFNLSTYYNVGNQVFWNGKTYTCQVKTTGIPHTLLLQFGNYGNVPAINIFPDDPTNGVQYWGIGTPVIVAPGQLPTGWTSGDNRNRSMVRHTAAIALYLMHQRIAPKNTPELRVVAYMGHEDDRKKIDDGIIYPEYSALGWLQAISGGKRTASLPLIQPRSGGRIRWGSDIKNENGY